MYLHKNGRTRCEVLCQFSWHSIIIDPALWHNPSPLPQGLQLFSKESKAQVESFIRWFLWLTTTHGCHLEPAALGDGSTGCVGCMWVVHVQIATGNVHCSHPNQFAFPFAFSVCLLILATNTAAAARKQTGHCNLSRLFLLLNSSCKQARNSLSPCS